MNVDKYVIDGVLVLPPHGEIDIHTPHGIEITFNEYHPNISIDLKQNFPDDVNELNIDIYNFSSCTKPTALELIGDGVEYLNRKIQINSHTHNNFHFKLHDIICNSFDFEVGFDQYQSRYDLSLHGCTDINLVGRHVNNIIKHTDNKHCIGFLVCTSFTPLNTHNLERLITYAHNHSYKVASATVVEGM